MAPTESTPTNKPGGSGDVTGTAQILWTYTKGTAYVVSPILYEGLVYLVNDRGGITAMDARTGEINLTNWRCTCAGHLS